MTSSLNGEVCLVTGGGGLGGSHLSEQLVLRGANVCVLDRFLPKNSYLRLSGTVDKVEFVTGDVRDLALLLTILERFKVDTVYHLAAQPIVPISNCLPAITLDINANGTYTVLEAIRQSRSTRRLVFASSGSYYGDSRSGTPIDEQRAPQTASNIYAASKVAGDIAVRCYAQTFGIHAAVCRFINTYGPGDANFSRIVPRAIKNLIDPADYDFGDRDDGTTQLDYMHVRDMATAYIQVAENLEAVSGEAFNFGTGIVTSTRDIALLIARLFGGEDRTPCFHGAPRTEPRIKLLDMSKASEVLSWRASTSLEEGLKETIAWYKQNWRHF